MELNLEEVLVSLVFLLTLGWGEGKVGGIGGINRPGVGGDTDFVGALTESVDAFRSNDPFFLGMNGLFRFHNCMLIEFDKT